MSADGRWLVTVTKADRLGSVPTDQVVIQDARDWNRPARTLKLGEPVLQVAASATTVAAETIDGRLYLIDPVTLRVNASVQRADLPDGTIVDGVSNFGPALAIDPTGRYLGYAGPSGEVNLLSLAAPRAAARSLPAPGRTVQTLAFSADGARLAVGFADGGVMVAGTQEQSAAENLTGHTGGARAAVWANGQLLTDAGDSTVIGWQTATTSPLLTTDRSTVSNVVTMGRFGDVVIGILGSDGLLHPGPSDRRAAALVGAAAGRGLSGLAGRQRRRPDAGGLDHRRKRPGPTGDRLRRLGCWLPNPDRQHSNHRNRAGGGAARRPQPFHGHRRRHL